MMNTDELEVLVKILVALGTVAVFFGLKYLGHKLLAWWHKKNEQKPVAAPVEVKEEPSEVGEIVLRALARDVSEWWLDGNTMICWQNSLVIDVGSFSLRGVWWKKNDPRNTCSSLLPVLNGRDFELIFREAREVHESLLSRTVAQGVDEVCKKMSEEAVAARKRKLEELEKKCIEKCAQSFTLSSSSVVYSPTPFILTPNVYWSEGDGTLSADEVWKKTSNVRDDGHTTTNTTEGK